MTFKAIRRNIGGICITLLFVLQIQSINGLHSTSPKNTQNHHTHSRQNIQESRQENAEISSGQSNPLWKQFIKYFYHGSPSDEYDQGFFDEPIESASSNSVRIQNPRLTSFNSGSTLRFDISGERLSESMVFKHDSDRNNVENTNDKLKRNSNTKSQNNSIVSPLLNIRNRIRNATADLRKTTQAVLKPIETSILFPVITSAKTPTPEASTMSLHVEFSKPHGANASITFPKLDQNSNNNTVHNTSCDLNQLLFQSICQNLLQRGSCPKGQRLIEDDKTGKPMCRDLGCNFPTSVSYHGECVMLKYFSGCPDGMNLILTRSGKAECDCKPRFIFSKPDGKCFEAFTQGPCNQSEHFILTMKRTQSLELDSIYGFVPVTHHTEDLKVASEPGPPVNQSLILTPRCVKNPCGNDRYVCLKPHCTTIKDCEELNGPCQDSSGVVLINSGTLKPECSEMEAPATLADHATEERILGTIPNLSCSPGTKRDMDGQCKRTSSYVLS